MSGWVEVSRRFAIRNALLQVVEVGRTNVVDTLGHFLAVNLVGNAVNLLELPSVGDDLVATDNILLKLSTCR